MNSFKEYKRKGSSMMRPYIEGEDMSDISVSKSDTPKVGGMVAINPDDPKDQWYVAQAWFEDNYYSK